MPEIEVAAFKAMRDQITELDERLYDLENSSGLVSSSIRRRAAALYGLVIVAPLVITFALFGAVGFFVLIANLAAR